MTINNIYAKNANNGINLPKTGYTAKTSYKPYKAEPYAKKGEPTYIKDMDYDDDGEVTFDEFKKYCQEKGLSDAEIQQMLETRQKWKMMKSALDTKDKIAEQKNKNNNSNEIYAAKGDDNYDENMDSNNDGKVTHEEYLKYCKKEEESKKQQNTSDKINKVIEAYTKKEPDEQFEPEIRIEAEA